MRQVFTRNCSWFSFWIKKEKTSATQQFFCEMGSDFELCTVAFYLETICFGSFLILILFLLSVFFSVYSNIFQHAILILPAFVQCIYVMFLCISGQKKLYCNFSFLFRQCKLVSCFLLVFIFISFFCAFIWIDHDYTWNIRCIWFIYFFYWFCVAENRNTCRRQHWLDCWKRLVFCVWFELHEKSIVIRSMVQLCWFC